MSARPEGHDLALGALSRALAMRGQYDEAIRMADSARRVYPGLIHNLGYLYVKTGRREDAKQLLAESERLPVNPIRALNRAIMNGILGNNDEFFRWIDYEPHHAWVPWIRVCRNGPRRRFAKIRDFKRRCAA